MSDDANPVPLKEGLHDVRGHRHPSNMFDIAPGKGLLISDERKRFQKRPGIARRALIPEAAHPGRQLLPHLNAPARGDLLEHESRRLVAGFEGRQGLPNLALLHRVINLKEVHQAVQGKGLPCSQQGPLHNIF